MQTSIRSATELTHTCSSGTMSMMMRAHLVGVVWLHDEGVHMRELVGLSLDVLLDEVVRAVLGEDDVHLARGEAADVGAEHDGVRGLSTKGLHLRGTARGARSRRGAVSDHCEACTCACAGIYAWETRRWDVIHECKLRSGALLACRRAVPPNIHTWTQG
eukprot:156806-Pelagomonas_calceolata.AAC.3